MPITYKEIDAVDSGAQFVAADLHVHSYGASHDVVDPTMTVASIVDAAVKMGIKVLAITDHNSDANVAESVEYAQKHAGHILVLPGVEITTANGHLLAYFHPKDVSKVRRLLEKIEIVGDFGKQDSHTTMSMADVIKEVERQGGIAIAAHIDARTGFEALASGFPNWKKDIVCSTGLYGVEIRDSANLGMYSDDDDGSPAGVGRKQLISQRSKISGLEHRSLARVQGSDAHSLKDFSADRKIVGGTRLKVNELTYEAFRIALLDSQARVRSMAEIPCGFPRVVGAHISGGFLHNETYHFSDNLNCFIGGRGTGKSTALKAIGYGLGLDDKFEDHENCPDEIVVYCKDAGGVLYRYERFRGKPATVRAKDDGGITDVPVDAFKVECYSQGELYEVSKDPVKKPGLLQEFLDRHLLLSDLLSKERQLVSVLKQNSAQLIPLEVSTGQLTEKKALLDGVNKKIAIAEEGQLKEIVAAQTRLSNEKSVAETFAELAATYREGVSLSEHFRDYESVLETSLPITGVPESDAALKKIENVIKSANAELKESEKQLCAKFEKHADSIASALVELSASQNKIDDALGASLRKLQGKGLSGSLVELSALLQQKAVLVREINKINVEVPQAIRLRKDRSQLLSELVSTREKVVERRKKQLLSINDNLRATIEDYLVVVHYDPAGVIDRFKQYLLEKMQGTYFQEETAKIFCSKLAPETLAKLVLEEKIDEISRLGGVDKSWAIQISEKLRFYKSLHELEVMWKPPCPVITVKTKSVSPKTIPVNQLSDGQKHTIMLTIAMLAESNIPLIIDQPEDDLDNAFIFSAIVTVLRKIKERRQVILVTHNANIAVLGDAELLLPMRKNGDGGEAYNRGAVDNASTREAILSILEGGGIAFKRRKDMYKY